MQKTNGRYAMKLEYLRQFITINETGTLTKAAEQLHISQSTLTRNMYTLERILDVQLFDRSPNHLEVTPTGIYALPKFQEILDQHQQMIASIRAFNEKGTMIKGGSCSQGPIWKIKHLHESTRETINIELNLFLDEMEMIKKLENDELDFIITSFPVKKEGIDSQYYFKEQLYLSVPESHPLYNRSDISFEELGGETLLVRTELGIWQTLIDSLHHINFIVQDRTTFDHLIGQFSLPSFTTNISQQYQLGDKRNNILITDSDAQKHYFLSYKQNNNEIPLLLLSPLGK